MDFYGIIKKINELRNELKQISLSAIERDIIKTKMAETYFLLFEETTDAPVPTKVANAEIPGNNVEREEIAGQARNDGSERNVSELLHSVRNDENCAGISTALNDRNDGSERNVSGLLHSVRNDENRAGISTALNDRNDGSERNVSGLLHSVRNDDSVRNDEQPDVLYTQQPPIEQKVPQKKPLNVDYKSLVDKFLEKESEKPTAPEDKSLLSKMSQAKITDLKRSIAMNDRFIFIKELFNNDFDAYNRYINALNGCKSMEQAEQYLAQLKNQCEWDESNETVQHFLSLIGRKFC
ncbi:MAG: hypothetical protein FWG84_05595 [Bacteroidales bacterium]|nr:hypothetical protein [Bacteroidales bacterium]